MRLSDFPKATQLAGWRALHLCQVGLRAFPHTDSAPQLSRKPLSLHPILPMRRPRPKKSDALPTPACSHRAGAAHLLTQT